MRAWCLTSLVLCSCSGVLPTIAGKPVPPIELSYRGRDAADAELVPPENAPPPRAFQPFTDGEARARLGKRLRRDTVKLDGGELGWARYLELLNAYEKFLNELGASLRDPDGEPAVLLRLKPTAPKNTPSSPGTFGDPRHPTNDTATTDACFFDGYIDSGWLDATACLDDASGNDGWFGVDLCGEFTTLLKYRRDEQSMLLHQWQNMIARVVLFGARAEAAKMHADVDWAKARGDKGLGPLPGSSLGLHGTTQTKAQSSAKIWVPAVDVHAGPIVMRVFPRATVTAAIGKVSLPLDHAPEQCDESGRLQLQSAPWVKLTVDATGGAVVPVKFALEGSLTLADDTFAAETALDMQPAKNQYQVSPRFTVNYQHRVGALYLTVDADFGFTHKRWRIELERSDGERGSKTLEIPPRSFRTR
ncbi:MAG TPA: hypothetical protein VFF06_31060 [Polyangia bacterium]|nr:hypothetical protein [Polyangia bacterium]